LLLVSKCFVAQYSTVAVESIDGHRIPYGTYAEGTALGELAAAEGSVLLQQMKDFQKNNPDEHKRLVDQLLLASKESDRESENASPM
jgi:hypothetical protein